MYYVRVTAGLEFGLQDDPHRPVSRSVAALARCRAYCARARSDVAKSLTDVCVCVCDSVSVQSEIEGGIGSVDRRPRATSKGCSKTL